MGEFYPTVTFRKQSGWCRSSAGSRGADSDTYDLEVEATCPKCGFGLHDPKNLERMPTPGSWCNGTSRAKCAFCGYVYLVKLEVTEAPPLSTR
jgi:rubredoxin